MLTSNGQRDLGYLESYRAEWHAQRNDGCQRRRDAADLEWRGALARSNFPLYGTEYSFAVCGPLARCRYLSPGLNRILLKVARKAAIDC